MIMEVHNYGLHVANVQIDAIAASSVFLIGDNDSIVLSSFLIHLLRVILYSIWYH